MRWSCEPVGFCEIGGILSYHLLLKTEIVRAKGCKVMGITLKFGYIEALG